MAKSKYTMWLEPDGLALIQTWARKGLTDKQIAHNMKIGVRTLYEYRQKYPQILRALKKEKKPIDYVVENALLKKALSGNTTAMIYWLKNRRPDKWRNNNKKHINGDTSVPIIDDETKK